jgi:2'-5' RNA ligase
MDETTRTFVAVEIPDSLGESLARLQARLEPEAPGVRWNVARPFHITLVFLGDVRNTDLDAVHRAVDESSAGMRPFELELERLGAFPSPKRPRVLWAGVGGPGLDALSGLQRRVAEAVAGVGYPSEGSPFHPHVTLGRLKAGHGRPPRDLAPVIGRLGGWSASAFTVSEIVTFASRLTPSGPTYTPIGRVPLRAEKPSPPA